MVSCCNHATVTSNMLHGYIAFQVDYRKNTHLQARCDAKLKVKVHKLESHIIIIIKYKKKAVCL